MDDRNISRLFQSTATYPSLTKIVVDILLSSRLPRGLFWWLFYDACGFAQITASLEKQEVDPKAVPLTKTATREEVGQTGDARASWLPADVAHGGPHNWHKKEAVPKPGDISDPRHP